jgi:hypothetical protein
LEIWRRKQICFSIYQAFSFGKRKDDIRNEDTNKDEDRDNMMTRGELADEPY